MEIERIKSFPMREGALEACALAVALLGLVTLALWPAENEYRASTLAQLGAAREGTWVAVRGTVAGDWDAKAEDALRICAGEGPCARLYAGGKTAVSPADFWGRVRAGERVEARGVVRVGSRGAVSVQAHRLEWVPAP